MMRMMLPKTPTTTPKGTLPTTVAQWVIRSSSCFEMSIGAERASAEMTGVTMPTVSARNQYAFEMSRQLCTSPAVWMTDRKSTRLNSSHEWISYAVFCLKKKKKNNTSRTNIKKKKKKHK